MGASECGPESAELLAAAEQIVREQQEQLRALNERAKSLLKQLAEEQERLRNQLYSVDSDQTQAQIAEQPGSSGLATIWNVSSGDRQAPGQRYLDVSERLAALQRALQRLRWLIRQAEIMAQFLTIEPELLAHDDAQAATIARARALQAEEMERQRLAREIHDGPAQILANAVFQLEYCERLAEKEPERLRRELAILKNDVRTGLAEVRQFIFDLRPAPASDIGLQAMLRHYIENYRSRFQIDVEADLADVGRLPAAQETAIYRIVQEALQNALKHSHASKIKVSLERNSRSIIVTIADNGIGFDIDRQLAEQVGHFGLTSMRERCELIGGELEIVSQPGQGTRVVLRVPQSSNGTSSDVTM